MNITYGGCLGKPDVTDLLDLLSRSHGSTVTVRDFNDTEVVPLPVKTDRLVSSVDLLYEFGVAPEEFGRVSVHHALSDLFAGLAQPTHATVVLGLGSLEKDHERAVRALASALATLSDESVVFGGGHTVHSQQMFLSISATGVPRTSSLPTLKTGDSYRLLLSKPVGSGAYLAALRHALLPSEAIDDLVKLLTASNRESADALLRCMSETPESVGFVTDVSGYGLLLSIFANVPQHWSVRLYADSVPLLPMASELLRKHAMTTRLGDSNLMKSLELGAQFIGVTPERRLLLVDPQTSGGLLAAVRSDSAFRLTRNANEWWEIGTISLDHGEPGAFRVSGKVNE